MENGWDRNDSNVGNRHKKCMVGARDGEAGQGLHLLCLSLRKKRKNKQQQKTNWVEYVFRIIDSLTLNFH